MPRYSDAAKEQVRDAVDFHALVEQHTELRRTGHGKFMGLCPFHDERTPSFSVDTTEKWFNCFGCGEKGDLFDFVALTQGLDFPAALEFLADRSGVELQVEDEDPEAAERRKRRERLLELLERTTAFYERFLWESRQAAKAREYLMQRGLTEATLREFRVGFSPSAWDTVLKSSMQAGYKAPELYDAGLVARAKGEGRVYDYFRGRIMFPLADRRGKVIGFGARTMRADQKPKYLNTSEKRGLFHKGSIVYAGHLARPHAAKANAVIVCEGYTDVLALHQSGVRNAVACMGTSLTEEQVVELGRMANVVQLALDADDAGQDAMLRAAKVAAGRKLELRVVPLTAGRDPAEVALEEGADAIRSLVGRSVPFVRFQVERTLALGDLSSAEGKDRVIEQLQPAFAGMAESVLREELLALAADRLDIAPDLARRLLLHTRPTAPEPSAPARQIEPEREYDDFGPPPDWGDDPGSPFDAGGSGDSGGAPVVPARRSRWSQQETMFLALCARLPDEGAAALGRLDVAQHFSDPSARQAAGWLAEHAAAPLEGLDEQPAELQEALAAVRRLADTLDEVRPATIEVERLRLELALVERQMAAPAGDVPRHQLARRRQELQVEMDHAMERSLA
ncbi:MAG TPA: DNA primase [Capillimicrobium sp.]|jgi:DNA primase